MDVADLAPALLGISELCKITNRKFNGERAAVKVLIGSDVEHKCFQIDLNVVQTLWEHTKAVLANDDVKTAKEVLEWIGLLATSSGGVWGFFKLLKHLGTRKISSATLESREGKDVVRVTIEGDNNTVVVYPQTLELLADESAVSNARKVVAPIAKDGYDFVEFEANKQVFEHIDKKSAREISGITPATALPSSVDQPQTLTAWVSVYAPVYDANAPMWRFKFGDTHQYMDISETTIAATAILRGGSMIDDAYRVKLELTQEHSPSGVITNHYKIKDVLDFRPAKLPYQLDAFKESVSNQLTTASTHSFGSLSNDKYDRDKK